MLVFEWSKITLWEWHLFQNLFYYGSFRYVSPLHKKVFSRPSVTCFFLLGLKYLRFCSFWECFFWSHQRSQFESDTFSRIFFSMEVLGMCLANVKRFFQEHQWSTFFFRAQISQILLFSRVLISNRSKITV